MERAPSSVAATTSSPSVSAVPSPPRSFGDIIPFAFAIARRYGAGAIRQAGCDKSDAHMPQIVDGFVVLGAEIAWKDAKPQVLRPPVDWAVLRETGKPIGIAMRIDPFAESPRRATGGRGSFRTWRNRWGRMRGSTE